jgi:hypothetical protein
MVTHWGLDRGDVDAALGIIRRAVAGVRRPVASPAD